MHGLQRTEAYDDEAAVEGAVQLMSFLAAAVLLMAGPASRTAALWSGRPSLPGRTPNVAGPGSSR